MDMLKTVAAIILLITITVASQKDAIARSSDLYRVETMDGNVLTGTIVSEDSERIILRVESVGDVTI